MDASGPATKRDRWERHDWWAVVLDAPDVAVLARFYRELRGWSIHHLDENDASLDPGEGVAYLNIQRNQDYVRPTWPTEAGKQQMMLHLDFEVTDLEAETNRAVGLGASLPIASTTGECASPARSRGSPVLPVHPVSNRCKRFCKQHAGRRASGAVSP